MIIKNYIKKIEPVEMHCPECCSILIIIKNDKTITFYKCCIGNAEDEKLRTITFDEMYSQPDPFNYLISLNKIFAPNHNFDLPQKYKHYCNGTKKCNYIHNKIDTLQLCVTGCNLNCIKCPLEKTIDKDANDMYWYLMESIKNHNLWDIHPTCNGEPFLQKEKMMNYIRALTSRDCRNFNIISNGTLLNEIDINEIALIKKNNDVNIPITISCDSTNVDVYCKIHKNANQKMFNTVMDNIFLLQKYNLLSAVNIVIQPENMDVIYKDLEFWKNNNIKFRVFPIRYYTDRAEKVEELRKQIQKDFPENYSDA